MIDLKPVLEEDFTNVWKAWFAGRTFYRSNYEHVLLVKQMLNALTQIAVCNSLVNWNGYNRRENLFA